MTASATTRPQILRVEACSSPDGASELTSSLSGFATTRWSTPGASEHFTEPTTDVGPCNVETTSIESVSKPS
jgi:hypothetical protein